MPSVNEVNNYYNKSLSIVKKSAEIMIDGFSKKKETLTKAVDWDFVTEFDKKVEDNLIQQLLREFPEHKIIAEESQSGAELTSDPTWIIDPIDGTTNFMHGYPQSCISVALTINKELVIGIVYNPIMNQMFTAKKGQGAFLNGQPIRASKTEDLSKSLLALELSHGRHPSRHNQMMKSFDACVSVAHGVRTVGSSALTLCYVAMGGLDAYYANYLNSWDIAAGVLILREAGGTVISTNGDKFDLMTARVLAAGTNVLAQNLAKLLKDF
ncbi:unnamed protein product [Bemisia tabaci]|uniref:Inositol-1-monophosphatase n=1 Tax=Bemisia tabaci TaxID=7038 RepID=A0A9P0A3S8_BEMTA|nr:PREDICTED: inositol monophosphatase 1-like isoform X2 [Bemisia tabaci]CAH0385747.1 unnamed protein product [Bemisia tabaci]